MWSRRLAPSAVVAAAARRLTSTHSMHTFAPAAVPHAHVHGASCSHDHAAAVPSSSASLSGSSASRPQPPVLAKGQMPPGDHPHLPGWYQRPLPHTLIPFSSNKGKAVFKEAMNRGGMEGYFALAEQFQTQSTPACQYRSRQASNAGGKQDVISHQGPPSLHDLVAMCVLLSVAQTAVPVLSPWF